MLAAEGLSLLREGNRRFRDGGPRSIRPATFAGPVAAILCCSGMARSPEVIFDQPPGMFYVVQGQALDPSGLPLESLVFGIESLRLPLVVVLGHGICELCGVGGAEEERWRLREQAARLRVELARRPGEGGPTVLAARLEPGTGEVEYLEEPS